MISVEEQIAPSVFADPSILNLTLRQFEKALPILLEFLVKYRSRVGSILMGLDHGSWTNADLRQLENLILEREPDAPAARPRQTTKRWRSNCQSMAIPLRLWEKRRLKQSRLSDSESPKNPAPKTMKPAWLQSVQQVDWVRRRYDFLYVAETSGRPLDEVDRQYGFDDARSHAIIERARYLRDLPSGNADRRHRRESFTPERRVLGERKTLLCPRRPIQARDQTIVERFSPRFEALTRGEPALLHPALRCYVHKVWTSRNGVIFHHHAEADNALSYLECLMRLGILRKELRWFSFSKKKRSKDLAEWKSLLKLNRHDTVERLKAPNKESNAAEAWLGIAPRFYDSDDSKEPSQSWILRLSVCHADGVSCIWRA